MEYGYNLSGALVEQKYPSGRVVRNVLDNDGDLSMVQSKRNANHGYWNYANHFTYTAAGAVSSMQLGNGTWEKTAFNSRLQPTRIALGKVPDATDLLKLDYTYGTVVNGQLDTTKNNGNIQSQTITVPTVGASTGFTAVQTYNYDPLNRIDDATEMITPAGSSTATQSWKQDYTFDRYGNRNLVEANTTTIPKNCGTSPSFTVCPADRKVFNPSIANTNRINLDQDGDSVNDYAFDSSGNTTRNPQMRRFTYDAENKQTKVETVDANGNVTGTIGQYWFDGDGRRVKKIAYANNQPTETTVFVYDASSRLVAEYSTILNETPQVAYLTNDHLGSPRMNTDENGAVISRHDYLPFGEEINAGTGGRTTAQGYGGQDSIRQKFTGYERDAETDLDFAQARMYNKNHGRFTSADPIAGLIINPQSHNKYAYAWNNPLILTDPTGLVVSWEDSEKKKKKGETEARTDAQRAYEKRLDEMVNSDDKKTREKGLKLKATYEKLQKSDITFHVVKEDSSSSSGELSYKGEKGHLYVSLKGNSSEYGALPLIQKLGHEFKHGEQFLDGQLGFQQYKDGSWHGYRDDNVDEAEAWIAGFDAQYPGPDQTSGTTGKFVNDIARAYPSGVDAVAKVLNESSGTYRGRGVVQQDIKEKYWKGGVIPPTVYAVPRK